jgi:hypothetical protein
MGVIVLGAIVVYYVAVYLSVLRPHDEVINLSLQELNERFNGIIDDSLEGR